MTEHLAEPLLRTKLFIPQVRREGVRRERLIAQLNAGIQRPLTLVSAPAGFGKTTVLSEWAGQLPMPVAWVSLDEGDNDQARFLVLLSAALQTVLPRAGEAALMACRSPEPPRIECVLTAIINEIGADSFALVLDDYHVIRARQVHDAVAFLIDHLPAPMHLVIATRSDPSLPLARLRGRMQLAELRAADLRFSTDEAMAFLSQVMGLSISRDDVAALEARTEGWIVGLQLAGLSMKGREDIPGFIAAFTGSHRYVLDYLTEEVLRRQPEEVLTFLLHTSILDRLCGPLCDALLSDEERPEEGGQAQAMLERLERENLFVVPLDDERRWYRYHHLFADLLRSQLGRSCAGQAPELHRRASLWYERNGLIPEAVRHALHATDWQRAADLVERHSWQLLDRASVMTVLGWLAALPDDLVRARPALCIYYAWILLLTGQSEAVEPHLQQAVQSSSLRPSPADGRHTLADIATIRAYAASHEGDVTRAVALAREALQSLPEHDSCMRSVAYHTLGTASLLIGDVTGACHALAEAGRMARATGCTLMAVGALCTLAEQQMVLGQLHQAAETYQTALHLATGRDGKPLPHAVRAFLGLSELHYEWNDLLAATRLAQEAKELGKHWGSVDSVAKMPLALAGALLAQGDTGGARQALQEADDFARGHYVDAWAVDRLEACRVRLLLAPDGADVAAAARWAMARASLLEADAELPYVREREHLALARVLIAQGRHFDALGLLARLRQAATAGGRAGRATEILVLEAAALHGMGDGKQAIAALEQALALAEPEGYVRTFLDEGAPVAALLSKMIGDRRSPHAVYASRLLAAFGIQVDDHGRIARLADPAPAPPHVATPALRSTPWLEPLSERESEVLRWMAAGLSNAEIAQRLVIAVSTVKRHVNHIFAKLGVTTRTQALVKAKELGLL